jgi:hypothetical protein
MRYRVIKGMKAYRNAVRRGEKEILAVIDGQDVR